MEGLASASNTHLYYRQGVPKYGSIQVASVQLGGSGVHDADGRCAGAIRAASYHGSTPYQVTTHLQTQWKAMLQPQTPICILNKGSKNMVYPRLLQLSWVGVVYMMRMAGVQVP